MSELEPASARGLPTAQRWAPRHWLVMLSRAIVAIAVALAVTFSADHSAIVGFLAVGLFTVLSAIVVGLPGALVLEPGIERGVATAQGLVSLLAGIAAFALRDSDVAVLLFVLSAWAAITGFLELYLGIRSRGRRATSRDWVFAGALTAALSVVVLLVPADFQQRFVGPDGVERALSASVVVVGVFGAYCAILGVYLVIGALSLKWATASGAGSVRGAN